MVKASWFVVFFGVLVCCLEVYGEPVSEDMVRTVARNWLAERTGEIFEIASVEPGHIRYNPTESSKTLNGNPCLYVVQMEPAGYVIVTGDDFARTVICYSPSDTFFWQNLPPAFKVMLENAEIEIAAYTEKVVTDKLDTNIGPDWERLLSFSLDKATQQNGSKKDKASVGPLMTTDWGQGKYYNASCPENILYDGSRYNGHTMVGCVAVAMAQILRHNEYPLSGSGTASYTHETYGYLSRNLSQITYNWNDMPNSLSSHNKEVADFLFDVGISVEMNYGDELTGEGKLEGSGAWSSDAAIALRKYFGYPLAIFEWRKNFDTITWIETIKENISDDAPVYYRGQDESSDSAHAFVLDGYDNSDNFHVNWGWDGSYQTTYYSIDDMTPGSHEFNHLQGAIINIKPPVIACNLSVDMTVKVINTAAAGGRNVRDCAGTGCPILGEAKDGDTGTIIDGPVYKDDFTWWEIDWDDATPDSWIADYNNEEGMCVLEEYIVNEGEIEDEPDLIYHSHEIEDDIGGGSNGDDDGIVEPGEIIELDVRLENTGAKDAHGVTAILSTSDNYVSISDDDVNFDDINVRDVIKNNADFDFRVDQNCPTPHEVTFTLDIHSDEGSWSDFFVITVEEQDNPIEGEVPEGEQMEGEGEVPEGESEGEAPEGEPEGEPVEGEGEVPEGEPEGEAPEGEPEGEGEHAAEYHPVDMNKDRVVVIEEVTAYGSAWSLGETWPVAPTEIPIAYVTNSGLIWTQGETYCYEEGAAPSCWTHCNTLLLKDNKANAATRAISETEITISVSPESKVNVYAVEDALPIGLSAFNVNEGGNWDSVNNMVKWGPFFDSDYRTLAYSVSGPNGNYTLSGTASFDGNNVSIAGNNFIHIGSSNNSTASRSIDDTDITITVAPDNTVASFAVEDQIPDGLAATNISLKGSWDAENRKVKWGPFFDNSPRTLAYTVVGPAGSYALLGIASFNGTDISITGDNFLILDDVEGEHAEGELIEGEHDPVEGEGEPVEGEHDPIEGEWKPNEGEAWEGELQEEEYSFEGEWTVIEVEANNSTTDTIAYLRIHYSQIDTDNNGLLTYYEIIDVLPNLTRSDFNRLDRNGSGYISREELQEDVEGYCKRRCGSICCSMEGVPTKTIREMLSDWLLLGLSSLILLVVSNRKLL